MNASTSISQRGASPAGGASRARVSAKTRKAIGYIVRLGCTQQEAADLAGMNADALSRALSKPLAKTALEQAKLQAIQEIKADKPLYEALAWKRAHQIAQESKDERTSLKAVELLTLGQQQRGVQVNVQTNVHAAGGYEFVPPNARVVDVLPLDQASSDTDADTPAIADDVDDA